MEILLNSIGESGRAMSPRIRQNVKIKSQRIRCSSRDLRVKNFSLEAYKGNLLELQQIHKRLVKYIFHYILNFIYDTMPADPYKFTKEPYVTMGFIYKLNRSTYRHARLVLKIMNTQFINLLITFSFTVNA